MSAKYANLPDIDTAQDVYETEDVEPAPKADAEGSDEDGQAKPGVEGAGVEELDPSSLLSAKEARKRFRKAEKRKPRSIYSYPAASGSSSDSDSVPATMRSRHKQASQFERLLALKQELALLERELGDGAASVVAQGGDNEAGAASRAPGKKKGISAKDAAREDPSELLKGVHDVRARLDKIGTARENRGRLVDTIVGGGGVTRPTSSLSHAHPHGPNMHGIMTPRSPTLHSAPGLHRREGSMHRREGSLSGSQTGAPHSKADEVVDPGIAKLDSRVGELERIIGSSSAALDESAPLPPPLLPMITRLNSQLTILTQPRTIDSISRRLKLLLTDLDRIAAANPAGTGAAVGGQGKQPNAAGGTSTVQEQLTPILQRLAPHLPTLPHILARLRTLSSLHAAASDFQRGMEQLESQQTRNRSSLNDLESAVKALEKNIQENGEVEKSNVAKLEANVQGLMERLEAVRR